MRYVRTYDGHIFEVSKNLGKYGMSKAVMAIDMQGNVIDLRTQNNIFKESDNIGELGDFACFKSKKCDEMIIAALTGNRSIEHLEWYMRNGDLDMLRLMILVGKDLRCVAEMDKEGEWRLE